MSRIHIRHFFILLTFPLTFILHALNEYFGLIPFSTAGKYFFLYLFITIAVAFVSHWLFKSPYKSFAFAFLLLVIYFGFGAFKDFTANTHLLHFLSPYSRFLSLLALIVLIAVLGVKRTNKKFINTSYFIALFLLLSLIWETGSFVFKTVKGAHHRNDFGDHYHKEIENIQPQASANSPDVYWLIFDEYASSHSLKKIWNFDNPLDSILLKKGFYIADSAKSNYSYTLFSIISTMDMTYLKNIRNRAKGTPRDMAKSIYAIKETNIARLFASMGYTIVNYSLWDFEKQKTRGDRFFAYVPPLLLKVKTIDGRIQRDIGWHFRKLWAPNQEFADSIVRMRQLKAADKITDDLIQNTREEIQNASNSTQKTFNIFHFSLPHQPFMYDSVGNIIYEQGAVHSEENYLKNIPYTNKVINELTDSLISLSKKKNIVVIIQGDHGFKFKETDPEFETESCKIFYAVYNSNRDYKEWYSSISSVNGFRILLNKYFQTSFPLLPDSSYNIIFQSQ